MISIEIIEDIPNSPLKKGQVVDVSSLIASRLIKEGKGVLREPKKRTRKKSN